MESTAVLVLRAGWIRWWKYYWSPLLTQYHWFSPNGSEMCVTHWKAWFHTSKWGFKWVFVPENTWSFQSPHRKLSSLQLSHAAQPFSLIPAPQMPRHECLYLSGDCDSPIAVHPAFHLSGYLIVERSSTQHPFGKAKDVLNRPCRNILFTVWFFVFFLQTRTNTQDTVIKKHCCYVATTRSSKGSTNKYTHATNMRQNVK